MSKESGIRSMRMEFYTVNLDYQKSDGCWERNDDFIFAVEEDPGVNEGENYEAAIKMAKQTFPNSVINKVVHNTNCVALRDERGCFYNFKKHFKCGVRSKAIYREFEFFNLFVSLNYVPDPDQERPFKTLPRGFFSVFIRSSDENLEANIISSRLSSI